MLDVAQPPAAEVAGRGGGEGETADLGRLVPVQLAQPVRGDAPALQVGADAERHGEHGVRAGQRLDRRHVQVVVVVVGDDDDVDRAERGQRQRARGAAAWGRRRGTGSSARPTRGRTAPAARRSRRARWSDPSRSAGVRWRAAGQGRRGWWRAPGPGPSGPAGAAPPCGSRSWRARRPSRRAKSGRCPRGSGRPRRAKWGDLRMRAMRSPYGSTPKAAGRGTLNPGLGKRKAATVPPGEVVQALTELGLSNERCNWGCCTY